MKQIILSFLLYVIGSWAAGCGELRVRKEWRTLSPSEKSAYISAVNCLWTLPAKGSAVFPVKTRHDDFAAMHINVTGPGIFNSQGNLIGLLGPGIHQVGVFLPWHRYLLWVYETALKEECGYEGGQPYWDWSLDVPENGGAQFNASPIFDPVTGFGGNGANGSVPVTFPPGTTFPTGLTGTPLGSCIDDGPFANKLLVLDPGPPPNGILTAGTGRCLKRNFQPGLVNGALAWNANVEPVLNLTAYVNFTSGFDALAGSGIPSGPGIHGGGHIGTGGEMANVWSSIDDPLFYLHHGNLDRIWTLWQKKSPENVYAHGGPIYPNGTGVTTLDSLMYMSEFVAPSLPIRTVQDTLNRNGEGVLCYKYEEVYGL